MTHCYARSLHSLVKLSEMNSPTSSHDDSLPEPEITTAPSEPSPSPPAGETTISAPPDETAVSIPAERSRDPEIVPSEPVPSAAGITIPPPPSMAPPVSVPVRHGRGAAGWALLLALVSLGAAGFAVWQAHEWRAENVGLREDVAQRLQDSNLAIGESRARAQQENESLTAILGKIGALEGQVNKSEGLSNALEALYQQFSRSQEDRIIAEVRQAVEFAGQQLQYAGNIEMALIVLREAQTRLEQNDHGQFKDLRQAIKADIEKLNRQDTFDMPRTAERLEQVLEKIDKLPLAYSSEVLDDGSSGKTEKKEEGEGVGHFIRSLAADVWTELRSMVKFERLDAENEPVLLAPQQSAFLRENVKIRLLTARLAMLARDGHTYSTDLKRARNWIERFFDMRNEDVKAVASELSLLEGMPVGIMRNELIESAAAVARFRTRGGELPQALPPPPASTAPVGPPVPVDPEVSEAPEAGVTPETLEASETEAASVPEQP
jgi:uroporphyrin-3 C-methyltransferase